MALMARLALSGVVASVVAACTSGADVCLASINDAVHTTKVSLEWDHAAADHTDGACDGAVQPHRPAASGGVSV